MSREDLQRLSETLDDAMIRSAVGDVDVDAALDERDETRFENAWNSSYEAASQSESRLDDAQRAEIMAIRKLAHNLTYEATEHPELAGCVSDDFGLIATALVCDLEDGFVAHLLSEYIEGRFPIRLPDGPANSFAPF